MNLPELLRYIEEKTALAVNVEIRHPAFLDDPELMLAPDQAVHHSDACRRHKLSAGFAICVRNKTRSLAVAAAGRRFAGRCPHGLWEMATPVRFEDKLAAVIYCGGESPDAPATEKSALCRKLCDFTADFLLIALERRRRTAPDGKQRDADFYLDSCRRYIENRYPDAVTLADFAATLRVNANYLGELLKTHGGDSFREALNRRRIEEAKILLALHRDLAIGEIARRCGYADSNYFSVVFRRLTGVTPSAYRRRHRD